MKSLIQKWVVFLAWVLPLATCDGKITKAANPMPTWQKLCILGSLILVGIAAFLYKNRNRNIRLQELIRGYVSTGQSEITFVNIHNNSSGREVIEEAMASELEMDRSNSMEEENSYIEKDQELSIDSEEGDSKNLGSVFEKKQGSRSKKSKTRKRLANTAKIVEEEAQAMSPSEDL